MAVAQSTSTSTVPNCSTRRVPATRRELDRARGRYPEAAAWWGSLTRSQRLPLIEAALDVGVDPKVPRLFLRWLDGAHRALGRPTPLEQETAPGLTPLEVVARIAEPRAGGVVVAEVQRGRVVGVQLVAAGRQLVELGELPPRDDRTDQDLERVAEAVRSLQASRTAGGEV